MNRKYGFNDEELKEFSTLRSLISRLRAPKGCPWDRSQTHQTLKPYLIEECYEVIDATDGGDPQKLKEELGDLLLQIMLHAQIGDEENSFNIEDVIASISSKIIHRHPHVFGNVKASTKEEVLENWQLLKQQENGPKSILAGLSKSMPALLYSQTMQHRVAQAGFDWREVDGVIEKLVEEVSELKNVTDSKQRSEEFGDIIFTLCNIARRVDINLEEALRGTNDRFCCRFSLMEEFCRARGIKFEQLSFEEQNSLWVKAKNELKGA